MARILKFISSCVTYNAIVIVSLCFYTNGIFIPSKLPKSKSLPVTGSSGDPVFITPFLKNNDAEGGQKATFVPSLLGNITSYAGFITVDKKYNSNLFFWYFPIHDLIEGRSPSEAPTLLWLQGGPGSSSLYGVFNENGPYFVDDDGNIQLRDVSWTRNFNVLYIDNPVGTGFSFTQNKNGYPTTADEVAMDLYSALTQFFSLFPEVSSTDFYLAGEEYAGKYIPALADLVRQKNLAANTTINLQGLFIGNGFVDPVNMLGYSDYLYQLGLMDEHGANATQKSANNVKQLLAEGKYDNAYQEWSHLMDGLYHTGVNIYDYTQEGYYDVYPFETFIQQNAVRKALHVGTFTYSTFNKDVYRNFYSDYLLSVAHLLPELLNNYDVLFYNGQYDISVGYPLTENFLNVLSAKYGLNFEAGRRKKWRYYERLAGYRKTVGRLTHVLVRKASQNVPATQPYWIYSLLNTFVFNYASLK